MASCAKVLPRPAARQTRLRRSIQTPPARHWQIASPIRYQAAHTSSIDIASQHASKTAAKTAGVASKGKRVIGPRIKLYAYGTAVALFSGVGYIYFTDTRASAHQYLIPPIIRTLWPDAEEAHRVGTQALQLLYQLGLHPRERGDPDAAGELCVSVCGHALHNPIAISAGLDKNATIADALLALGAAVVEVGGVTPHAQPGNPRPRVFRLVSQQGLINRYGLNSDGADAVAARLRQRVRQFAYRVGLGIGPDAEQAVLDGAASVPPGSLVTGKLMCVQVAKNKSTPEADIDAIKDDYVYCVDRLARYADVIVVNVSSPNTPGLRSLQRVEPLTRILSGVVRAASSIDRKRKPAVMVKVSPDEDTDEQISGICDAIWESGVDGVIVGNTTTSRPAPLPRGYILPAHEQETLLETGGYSGPQLFDKTLGMVARYRKMLDKGPRLEPATAATTESQHASESTGLESGDRGAPSEATRRPSDGAPVDDQSNVPHTPKEIWATGGVTNGKQALQLLHAGASVAMIYTTMVFNGSGTVTNIKNQMRDEIKKH